MNEAILTLLADSGLALLLAATIGYCARLSGRIRLLQDSRSELGEMITRFDQATGRAMASLSELQTVSRKITEAMQVKIEKANFLADDLAFLIEKATKLAAQNTAAKPAQAEPSKPSATLSAGQMEKPQFESQFAKPKPAAHVAYAPPAPSNQYGSAASISSIEAVLQRLSAGSASGAMPAAKKPSAGEAPTLRTGAERELLEALKSGR